MFVVLVLAPPRHGMAPDCPHVNSPPVPPQADTCITSCRSNERHDSRPLPPPHTHTPGVQPPGWSTPPPRPRALPPPFAHGCRVPHTAAGLGGPPPPTKPCSDSATEPQVGLLSRPSLCATRGLHGQGRVQVLAACVPVERGASSSPLAAPWAPPTTTPPRPHRDQAAAADRARWHQGAHHVAPAHGRGRRGHRQMGSGRGRGGTGLPDGGLREG